MKNTRFGCFITPTSSLDNITLLVGRLFAIADSLERILGLERGQQITWLLETNEVSSEDYLLMATVELCDVVDISRLSRMAMLKPELPTALYNNIALVPTSSVTIRLDSKGSCDLIILPGLKDSRNDNLVRRLEEAVRSVTPPFSNIDFNRDRCDLD